MININMDTRVYITFDTMKRSRLCASHLSVSAQHHGFVFLIYDLSRRERISLQD